MNLDEEGANVPSFYLYQVKLGYYLNNLIEKITAIAEERFKESDLSDCFIVDIVPNNKKLDVFIDTDEGVKFWQCQKLSRAIEAYLDESLDLGESYTLEVSSPGITRPLMFKRQYPRNVGRKVEIMLKDRTKIKGKLTEVKEDEIIVESKGQKKRDIIINNIQFDDIEKTKVLISFSK